MIIGIEGQRLFRSRKHGMDMVALELIRNLQKLDKDNEYVVFVGPGPDEGVIQESPNFRIVRLESRFYPHWEQILLPRAAAREKCDLLHCTSNTAPLGLNIPLVITLHDIIYMEKSYPRIFMGGGTLYQKSGNAYRRWIVPKILRKSSRIITVSEFEKKRIASCFNLEGDARLMAVYNGVGEHFRPVTDKTILDGIRKKYNLPERYFLFLGNTDPKKNTSGVLMAYADFIRRSGRDIILVMPDYGQQELTALAERTGEKNLTDLIHLTGYLKNTDLPAIYSLCEAFLYPSLRESFGIPVLEAMACGVPVITSDTSSMPEVAGNAALLIDPSKPEEIADALEQITSDSQLRRDLTSKGMIRAAAFSWMSMAQQVREIYLSLEQEIKKSKRRPQ